MLKLNPYEVCPYGDVCKYAEDDAALTGKCNGLNANRDILFVCDLWEDENNARNYKKLSQGSSKEEN